MSNKILRTIFLAMAYASGKAEIEILRASRKKDKQKKAVALAKSLLNTVIAFKNIMAKYPPELKFKWNWISGFKWWHE